MTIDVGWHVKCISTFEERHLPHFYQDNDHLDVKNYIGRQKV